MLLNDKTYPKVARALFPVPVLYRSILIVYWDLFLPFDFSCVALPSPPLAQGIHQPWGIQQRGGGGGMTPSFLSVAILYSFVAFARCWTRGAGLGGVCVTSGSDPCRCRVSVRVLVRRCRVCVRVDGFVWDSLSRCPRSLLEPGGGFLLLTRAGSPSTHLLGDLSCGSG